MTNDPQEQTFITPEKIAVLAGKMMAHGMLRDRFIGGECFASGQREEDEAFEELRAWQDQFFHASMDIRQRGPVSTCSCYVLTEDGVPRCKVCAVKGEKDTPYHLDSCPVYLLERLRVIVRLRMSTKDVNNESNDFEDPYSADNLDILLPDLTQGIVQAMRSGRLDENPTVSSVQYGIELDHRTDCWGGDFRRVADHVDEMVRREEDRQTQSRVQDLTTRMLAAMVDLRANWDDYTDSAKIRRLGEMRSTFADVLTPAMNDVLDKLAAKR